MYSRLIRAPSDSSFFVLGPRGTGKSSWTRTTFPDAIFFDLLESRTYTELLAFPDRLAARIPKAHRGWIVIDEIQRIPELLNEVHRLIEIRKLKFVLTGSSARKLRKQGVNLLAGRALGLQMFPLTAVETTDDFRLEAALKNGMLPSVFNAAEPQAYLSTYVQTYLREEVLQEGLVRNLANFTRFLESASFSQASVLNVASVARDCGVERKVVEGYFTILEDLLIGVRVPVFERRAKRKTVSHPKFYFFDVGVYQTLRPRGPLDPPAEIEGAAIETLVLQELRAHNAYGRCGFGLHYWRDTQHHEVDFVLYGERGLIAIEVKRSSRIRDEDLKSLRLFMASYPEARAFVVYAGDRKAHDNGIDILPYDTFAKAVPQILAA